MSLSAAGTTPQAIRRMTPAYHLSPDLLELTLTALPPPLPDATASRRHARLTRLIQQSAAHLPPRRAAPRRS